MIEECLFVTKPTEEDLLSIQSWCEVYNYKRACFGYKQKHLFVIRHQKDCIAFMSYDRKKFISTIELSEVRHDMRNKGIGGLLLENALHYLKKTRIKGVELYPTSEGSQRHAQKHGFKNLMKVNDSDTWMFRPLIPIRSQRQVYSRMFVIWTNNCGNTSKYPDKTWPIDENTNLPILTYCYKDWIVGLMENEKVVSSDKAKRYFGKSFAEFNGEYLYINHSL